MLKTATMILNAVKTSQEFGRLRGLEGESPSLGVPIQPRKPSLGQCREVLSEGDVENREVHRRTSRPKYRGVKHRWRGKLTTMRKEWEVNNFNSMNQPN